MGISMLRATGRLFVPVAALAFLAGVSQEAGAGGGRGIIELELSNSGGPNRFVLNSPVDGKVYEQYFNTERGTKCIVADSGWDNYVDEVKTGSSAPSLVKVKAIRPNFAPLSNGNSGVGLNSGSLGVFDSTKGQSCGEMSTALEEGLVLTSKAGAFDEIRLDMEVKGSARFELIIDPDPLYPTVRNGKRWYTLYSGTDIPDGANQDIQSWKLGNTKFACKAGSDSGPDSDINDNCQWIIRDVGTSFSVRPIPNSLTTGTDPVGSLEGGGDYIDAGRTGDAIKNTEIHLTSLVDVGQLSCDPDPASGPDNLTARVFSDTEPAASCQVTRIATPGSGCDYVLGYKLETFTFESRCSLDKSGWVDSTGRIIDPADADIQLAGSNQITFNLEDRDVWDISKTYMTFTDFSSGVAQQTPRYDLHRCGGTVIYVDGQPTIKEVLDSSGPLKGYKEDPTGPFIAGPPDVGYKNWDGTGTWPDYVELTDSTDAVPGNNVIDWACILDNTELYEGSDKMRVIQHILFWGDAVWSRN